MIDEASHFQQLVAGIAQVDPHLADTTRQLEQHWATGAERDSELTELVARELRKAIDNGLFTLPSMVEGFKTFAHDFHERQAEFIRSGTYRARDYAEVSREVYSNDHYMRTVYYPALLLSYLAAPNYRHLLRHFDETLQSWRESSCSRLLEVASGHGFLLLFALSQLTDANGVGTDIAASAGAFASALHRSTGWGSARFQFTVADVLQPAHAELSGPFDAAICCELLEHVPEPSRFLKAIHGRLSAGGRLFVSAAVRMESVDHLTLFETTAQVAEMLRETGFEIVREMSAPFVTRRPRNEARWNKLLESPLVAATFIADCRKVG